jgi:signal recognition particle subunit SRP54
MQEKKSEQDFSYICTISKEISMSPSIVDILSFEKKLNTYDLILIDTAGRDSLSEELIEELNEINTAVKPDDTFLVLSADIGQSAQAQAQTFHENCSVTGVIITKLDGTSKGGGALVACSVTNATVRFLGVGEKTDDLEEFKPEGFVSRLLGMGDLEALLEKSREAFSEEEAKDLGKKFLKGEHNLLDLYSQMQSLKKMGSLSKIIDMIPGFSSVPKHLLEDQEEKMKVWKYLMQSMTKKELESPDIINNHRVKRISQGSGTNESDVRSLLKQYKQSKKMFKMLKPGSSEKDMQKMMQKMQMKGMKF